MKDQKETTETEVLSMIKSFGDYLIGTYSGEYGKPGWKIPPAQNPDLLKWNNPENIDSGSAGVILFLLELYKQSGEESYLKIIDESIGNLLIYCRDNPTGNYSLYTGRSGIVYILIQRYLLDSNAYWLKESLDIIKPANKEYLHSRYTSDYLYDGRAGTLLVILNLYKLTRDYFLLDYINQFVKRLIANVRFSKDGMSWINDEELHLRPSCGFAYGTAGIGYVLNKVNDYFDNPALDFIQDEINNYTRSSWISDNNNWGDFTKNILNPEGLHRYKEACLSDDKRFLEPRDNWSWANGTAGILLSVPDRLDPKQAEQALNKLKQDSTGDGPVSNDLFDGLAGLGICLWQISKTRNEYELKEIVFQVAEKLSVMQHGSGLSGGLLHGNMGVLYFLMKTLINDKQAENILTPFYEDIPAVGGSKPFIFLKLSEIRKEILSKYYPRVIYFLSNLMLRSYLGNTWKKLLSQKRVMK